jgi:hypothetical protein
MAFFNCFQSPTTLWLYVCVIETTLFTATNIIVIFAAICFDTLRATMAENTSSAASHELGVCISGLLMLCLLCWRLAFWGWIGITHQRFRRIGPPSLMINGVWAGAVLAAVPYGVLGDKTKQRRPDIRRYDVGDPHARTRHTS